MPITEGAKKKLRQDKKRTERNLRSKNTLKQAIKKLKKTPSQKNLSLVFRLLDISGKKNMFHKNKIKRLKSKFSQISKMKSSKKQESVTKKGQNRAKK
ncbi:30S ribosomal protein S20 [Candidatus Gottesmanbacteria bacterium]|nr:30S ribosomal protein S20 [Candidatus Gottesmanbacteria bacterium]